jgi:hypothetical protein
VKITGDKERDMQQVFDTAIALRRQIEEINTAYHVDMTKGLIQYLEDARRGGLAKKAEQYMGGSK